MRMLGRQLKLSWLFCDWNLFSFHCALLLAFWNLDVFWCICRVSERFAPTTSDVVGAKRSLTRQKLHPYVEPVKNKIPAKTNSRYRNISSPVQNCLHPPVKYENKFQSQNNHDSFNCRPSKSNPHSINQKSVIFGMHKTHPQSANSTNATSHLWNGSKPFILSHPLSMWQLWPIQRHHNVHRSEDMD